MKSLLHITNGDIFTEKLKSLSLKGDIITWREMLCEGKTLCSVGSESFWKTRFDFLNKNYNISKSLYIEKTLKEYRSLCNHKQQDHIVLWFEHDLFCQINMIAVLSWLKEHRPYAQVSLVSSCKETDKLLALGELTDEKLRELYENRKILTQDDIEYADYVWQLYCSDNPLPLENLGNFENHQFDYLSDSIKAHLTRFPSIKNGLNSIENKVLEIADAQKPKTKKQFLNQILSSQKLYGYGDTQYNRVLATMNPLFASLNPVRLNNIGKQILGHKTNFYATIRDNESYLGGVLKYNYLYNTASDRILKL